MRGLRFAVALLLVTAAHLLGVGLWSGFGLVFDLFLVVAVFNALDGDTFAGLAGGLVAGLVADAVSGGLYGLHGLADTLVGYGTAFATQRLVVQRPPSVFLVFTLAAALQQLTLASVTLLMLPHPEVTVYPWVVAKVIGTGALGVLAFIARRQLRARFSVWRRSRTVRVRMGRQ
jgi:rod shape-determining protein MreD